MKEFEQKPGKENMFQTIGRVPSIVLIAMKNWLISFVELTPEQQKNLEEAVKHPKFSIRG